MMTIKEMSRLTGVSARALRYYDEIGLFHPTGKSEAGYRLYDEDALAVLQQILYFRELGTPLKTIKEIIENPALDRNHVLSSQKKMLVKEKERLERMIASIDDALKGADTMDFTVFSREESTELFNSLFDNMPAAMRDTAIQEFGSAEKWKEHYLEAVSSEKVQKQYAKIVEWYGGKDAYTESVKHPLSEEIRLSYRRRIDHILYKLSEKKEQDENSFEVRALIGEYGFVMKQLMQLKDEKEIMLSQARQYLDKKTKVLVDNQYGEDFAAFLNRAIIAFYGRA